MNKSKLIFRFYWIILLLIPITSNAQFYMQVQASGNYWQHTEVFGAGVGAGISYQVGKANILLQYDYGYGSVNRLNSFDNVNYDHWSTILTKQDRGNWNEYLGWSEGFASDLEAHTDYGKQHQLSLMGSYDIIKVGGSSLYLGIGGFGSIVEQFFTFTNIPIHNVDFIQYRGPLNYIPSTSQKILTYGGMAELSLRIPRGNVIWTPYIAGGRGNRFSTFGSFGIKLMTRIMKKKKE